MKDVSAIANILPDQNAEGYVVIGVVDLKERNNCSDKREFVVGCTVTDSDALERRMNQILEEHIDPPLSLECRALDSKITDLGKDIVVVVIRGWMAAQEYAPQPYVLKKQVGKLRPGEIKIRRGTRAVTACREDIINLVAKHIRLKFDRDFESLRDEYRREIQSLQREHEQANKSLEEDFRKSVSELEKERDGLRSMVRSGGNTCRKLSFQKDAWRNIAYEALSELYPRIPGEVREGKLKRILAQGGKEGAYLEIVGEIADPDGPLDDKENDELAG